MKIIIRPLQEADAFISFKWRNNPAIWKYTGSTPDIEITQEIELDWIKKVLAREDEKRFAICIGEEKEYVGNVQLTNIEFKKAQFHIFIGKEEYHGKGIGSEATRLIIEYGFRMLKLNEIYLYVDKLNLAAINSYKKNGFTITMSDNDQLKMSVIKDD